MSAHVRMTCTDCKRSRLATAGKDRNCDDCGGELKRYRPPKPKKRKVKRGWFG